MKLLKISASDCPVCESFVELDKVIATENNMELEVVDYTVLAFHTPKEDPIRSYVENYCLEGEGTIQVPVYLIIGDDGFIKASSNVQEEEDLRNLFHAWDHYNKSLSKEQTV